MHISHQLIFALFHWLLWCKITGQLSRNNPTYVNICPSIISVEKRETSGKSQLKRVPLFPLYYLTRKEK